MPAEEPNACTPPVVEVIEGHISAHELAENHWSATIGATVRATNRSAATIRVSDYYVEVAGLVYNNDRLPGSVLDSSDGWDGPLEIAGTFYGAMGPGETVRPGASLESRIGVPIQAVPLADPTVGTFRVVDGVWRFDDDDVNERCLGSADALETFPISEEVDLDAPTDVRIADY